MFKKLNGTNIGVKLPLVMTLLAAAAVLTMSLVNAQSTQRLMLQGALEKVEAVTALKAKEVETLLSAISSDLELQAALPATSNALAELTRAYGFMENAESDLRRIYITDNSHPLAQKDKLVKANTGSSYGFFHEDFHPYFDALQDEMGYYDVFLIFRHPRNHHICRPH